MQAEIASAPPATHPFRDAFTSRDFEAMRELLSEDVVLNSPILSTPFVGREAVLELFEVITETLEDVRYTIDMAEGDLRFFSWHTHIGSTEMQGADILRLDEHGRIVEFTVFFRPLTGITVLASALGRGLAARRSPARARLVGAASAPLIGLARASDRLAPRLVK
ncbi:MAG TPA: nuclear transport factor 2 family protein [Thermoleophilaceae bacterium]|jgi:ketosteroid isomerase-like protein